MSQPDGRADQSQKTTAATKTTKPGAKKASKGGKSWFASIILTLVGVAVVTYLARSGGDTIRPPGTLECVC